MIDVSVIVPIYNMGKCVEPGLTALMAQKDVQMEVILVDDGSTDNSQSECERCIAGHPEFTYIRTENQGSGPARDVGIEKAQGEFLYFFDIDDSLEPDALSRMVAALRQSGCDLLVFGYSMTTDIRVTQHVITPKPRILDGDATRKDYASFMTGDDSIQGAPWNKLFRRDVVNQYHIEYPALRRHQDEVFIMRYMDKARSVCMIPDVLYHHLFNNLERVWTKYRPEYGQNVEALFDFFDSIIVAWNPDNAAVKERLYLLYYMDSLTAMKVLFNPKWHLSHPQRYAQLKRQVTAFRTRAQKYTGGVVPDEVKVSGYWRFITRGQCLPLYAALLHVINKSTK